MCGSILHYHVGQVHFPYWSHRRWLGDSRPPSRSGDLGRLPVFPLLTLSLLLRRGLWTVFPPGDFVRFRCPLAVALREVVGVVLVVALVPVGTFSP